MKKIQYLIIIGIFLMVSGMVASAYAFDDGSVANNISIFKKQPKNHDGGSDVEPGEPEDPGDQGDPGTVEDPADDDPAGEDTSVDIRPNTINLKRRGIFTAIIKLPEKSDMELFDPTSIVLFVDPNVVPIPDKDDTAEVDLAPPAIASFTPMTTVTPIRVFVDTFMTNSVIAKFSNQDILDLLEIPEIMDQVPAMVTFTVQWKLISDNPDNTIIYEASDEVRVINPGKGNWMGKGKGKGKGKGGGAE
jgi:hypothetical protein